MAKKTVNIVCGKCKMNYAPENPYLVKHLFNYKKSDDSNSYYKVCKKCLLEKIESWFDYDNIMQAFEDINVPFIEKIWHDNISITNARLLQANNNISATLSSAGYGEDLEDNFLLIITLFDEYFKKASQSSNQQYFFNKSVADSICYMEQEREKAEKIINDSIKNLELQEKQQKEEKMALLNEDLKDQLLDDYGYFRVDLLSDNDYIYLTKKWGLKYSNYELVKLEEYWIKTFQSFEIVTSTHQDLLLKIAKISLEIDNSMEKNEWDKVKDLTKLMKELMDSAQFTPKSKATILDKNFKTSIGELILYIEDKDGFIPKFDYTLQKDLIDLTIENLNEYTKSLVLGEVNLQDIMNSAISKMEVDQNMEFDEDEEIDDEFNEDGEFNYESSIYSNTDLESFANNLHKKKEMYK